MKQFMTAGAALLMTTSIATAGGLDRSGQSIGVIFEDGNWAELSYGSINPSLTGVSGPAVGAGPSGNIAPDYSQLGIGLKMQYSDQLSMAIIYDQPFGANVDYADPTYVAGGSFAEVESDGLTVLGRYKINPNFSVHGGLRYVQANGVYTPASFGGPIYSSTYSSDGGTGYVIGGAYEREDIALRLAVTYSSEIDLELDGTVGNLSTTLPESINVDFQTGIAADTLLFGSMRYVAWDGFSLNDSVIATIDPIDIPSGSILSYDNDVYTYNVGVGRRITDNFAASFSIGYEKSTGEETGQLGPTDGYISYQIGGAYTLDNGVEISGGIRYIDVGDANTEDFVADRTTSPDTTIPNSGATFANNDAVAIGLKVGFNF